MNPIGLLSAALALGLLGAHTAALQPTNDSTYPLFKTPGTYFPPFIDGVDYFHALADGIDSTPRTPPFATLLTDTPNYKYDIPDFSPVSGDLKPFDHDSASTASICGKNTLQNSSYVQTCSLVVGMPSGKVRTCSAFIIGDRYLGTAGHCLFAPADAGGPGFVSWAEVYCNADAGCGQPRTTLARAIAVSSKWYRTADQSVGAFDGGVVQTVDRLPYPPLPFGSHYGNFTTEILVSGFPGNEAAIPGSPCGAAGYDGCRQYSSEGTMSGLIDDRGFFRPNVSVCQGHSGSAVWDRSVGRVVGVFSGFSYSPLCQNFAVPLRLQAEVDNGCNGVGGGVSLGCLAEILAKLQAVVQVGVAERIL